MPMPKSAAHRRTNRILNARNARRRQFKMNRWHITAEQREAMAPRPRSALLASALAVTAGMLGLRYDPGVFRRLTENDPAPEDLSSAFR